MKLTYRYTYIGSRMIVYEYEGGRRGHQYEGRYASNGIGVTLIPMRGGYDSDSRLPYTKKYTNVFKLTPLPDYDTPTPTPIEPPARTSPTEAPSEEYLDNSRYTGIQLKLI